MRMQYGIGFVLAVMLSVPGCCCPMTCPPVMTCAPACCYPQPCCPQSCWKEQMEDAYCDFSDCMHHHACHFQHQMSCSMRQLMSNLTPTSSYQGENNYEEMPVSAKVPPISASKQKSSRRQKGKICQRCRQSPCRCGYCEGCDGFEEVGPNAPLSPGEFEDQHYDQYETLPPLTTAPYQDEVLPATPIPTPGAPTPIFKMPPSAAPSNPPAAPVTPPAAPASPPAEPAAVPADSANAPTARASRPAAPTSTASARTTTTVSAGVAESKHVVTPIDVTVPGDEDLKLKPINFTTHAPLKPDGWEATPPVVPAAN